MTTTTKIISTSEYYLLSTLLMSIIETNSVNGGRTGMNTQLALTQDILYTETKSFSSRTDLLIKINISNGKQKKSPGHSTLKKFQLETK